MVKLCKTDTLTEVFSREFSKVLRSSQRRSSVRKGAQEQLVLQNTCVDYFSIFRNTYFVKHLRTAAY